MIKCVIFDIDDTLYSYIYAHSIAFNTLLEYVKETFGIEPEKFEELHLEQYIQTQQEMGKCAAIHNRAIRYQRIFEKLGLPLTKVTYMENLYWNTLIENARPEPYIYELFELLKRKNIRIGIGTDMTAEWQFCKLEKLNLLDKIDFMVSSEEACAEKPDKKLFDLCVRKAKCNADECMFVGDSINKDIVGAYQNGLLGTWYCPDDEKYSQKINICPQTKRVKSFKELAELLD